MVGITIGGRNCRLVDANPVRLGGLGIRKLEIMLPGYEGPAEAPGNPEVEDDHEAEGERSSLLQTE